MKRLSIPQIVMMHSALIKETGGLDGIRDENLLDSAVNAPFQTFGGEYVYKTLEAKAARLGYSLVKIIPLLMATRESECLPCWFFWKSMALG